MDDMSKVKSVWVQRPFDNESNDEAERMIAEEGWTLLGKSCLTVGDIDHYIWHLVPPEPTLAERLRELADLYMPSSCIAEVCMAAIDELERLGKIEARIHELETEWGQANSYVPITWHGAARLIREAVWEFETDADALDEATP